MLRELQRQWRAALLGGESESLLAGLAPGGAPAAERLAVHRGTVKASLAEVLLAAFPATARLAGEANLRYAAGRFALAHPPRAPRLLAYGAGFPDWLAAFPPAAGRPWLADLARLEWARNEALFAADAPPLAPLSLAALQSEAVPGLRFTSHPTLRLLQSDWPLDRLWTGGGEPVAPEPCRLQVLRPQGSVQHHVLAAPDWTLLRELHAGATLAAAAEAAVAVAPGFDLQTALLGHLARGSFAGFRPG